LYNVSYLAAYKRVHKGFHLHEKIFIGSWTKWLNPFIKRLEKFTKERFFKFEKNKRGEVEMYHKRTEKDDWLGHQEAKKNEFGIVLFFCRPDLSNYLLAPVEPTSFVTDTLKTCIPKMFPWMEERDFNWWGNFLINEVKISFHFISKKTNVKETFLQRTYFTQKINPFAVVVPRGELSLPPPRVVGFNPTGVRLNRPRNDVIVRANLPHNTLELIPPGYTFNELIPEVC
jgi:hypothetical protein